MRSSFLVLLAAMSFSFSAKAAVSAPVDTIVINLDQRAKDSLPDYVLECKAVLEDYVKSESSTSPGTFLNFILTDLDQNVLAKYLWWTVTDQNGNVVLKKLMQKPAIGKCF